MSTSRQSQEMAPGYTATGRPTRARRFIDAPTAARCTYDITLRDGSKAQCGRRATRAGLCTQHDKIVQTKLVPPDFERCQAQKPNGATFMSLGAKPGLVRCNKKPVCIATEKKPGPDGLRGSMSLCLDCMCICIAQMAGHADFAEIAKEPAHV